MTKQILLPTSVFRELYQTFKVHRGVLGRALKYERNSKRDQMLRAAALERGGLIYTGEHAPADFCPAAETRFDHVRGMLYQTLGNRVELQVNMDTKVATIVIDGEVMATFDDMTIDTWGDVLYSLQKIYNQLNA